METLIWQAKRIVFFWAIIKEKKTVAVILSNLG